MAATGATTHRVIPDPVQAAPCSSAHTSDRDRPAPSTWTATIVLPTTDPRTFPAPAAGMNAKGRPATPVSMGVCR